jgi:DNA-binding transcriptional ArsR family regulator
MDPLLELDRLNALARRHALDSTEKELLFRLMVGAQEASPRQISAILKAHPRLEAVLRAWGEIEDREPVLDPAPCAARFCDVPGLRPGAAHCPRGDEIVVSSAQIDALAHPARLEILRILAARGHCVCGEVVEVMPLSQETVSQHLEVLKEAGLIQGQIDGHNSCYCLDPLGIAELRGALDGLLGSFSAAAWTTIEVEEAAP